MTTIRIGTRSGRPYKGLNERIVDGAQAPNEAVGGYNFRVGRGALETRPGITHAFEITARPTSYYALLAADGRVTFPYTGAYDEVMNGRPRWSWIISFRTPAAFSGTHWLLHQGVTIGSTQYDQGVYMNSGGRVYVALVDSAGGSETFNTAGNVLSAATNYVLQVTRYDGDAYVYWGTATSSADPDTAMGTTAALGETDSAHDSDDGDEHPIVFGAHYDLDTTTYSNYLGNGAQLHEVTLLQYFVNHCDFGWTSFADPLDPRCALHCRFEDASSHFTDLSANGNDSDAENGITYQQTTNAFVEESAVVQGVCEFTRSDDSERVVIIADGSMSVGNVNV